MWLKNKEKVWKPHYAIDPVGNNLQIYLVPCSPLKPPPRGARQSPPPKGGGSPNDGLPPRGGRLQRYFKAPQQWQIAVHEVCVSGTIHGHRAKISWV